MIAVIELAHFAYSHESFNAGTIYQFSLAYPGVKVKYFAEEEQIRRVSKIVPENNCVFYEVIEALGSVKRKEIQPSVKMYVDILQHVLLEKGIKAVVFTGYNYEYISSEMVDLIKGASNILFFFFQHGELEELAFPANRIERWGGYWLPTWKYRLGVARMVLNDYFHQIWLIISGKKKKRKIMYEKHLELLAECDRVSFFVFSNEYKKRNLMLPDKVTDKFIKIFLPYVFDATSVRQRGNDNIVRFLVCSSTAEAKDGMVWKVINYVNANHDKVKRSFEFVLGGGDCRKMNNTVPYTRQERGQHDLQEAMRSCDYLLLPYPAQRYVLSSSAVLTDAINMHLPIVMGASSCFNDYESYNIGKRGYSVKEIAEIVINLINDDSKIECNDEFINLKNEMLQSNINCFSHLF